MEAVGWDQIIWPKNLGRGKYRSGEVDHSGQGKVAFFFGFEEAISWLRWG